MGRQGMPEKRIAGKRPASLQGFHPPFHCSSWNCSPLG